MIAKIESRTLAKAQALAVIYTLILDVGRKAL
jgi:hypothetical protein